MTTQYIIIYYIYYTTFYYYLFFYIPCRSWIWKEYLVMYLFAIDLSVSFVFHEKNPMFISLVGWCLYYNMLANKLHEIMSPLLRHDVIEA